MYVTVCSVTKKAISDGLGSINIASSDWCSEVKHEYYTQDFAGVGVQPQDGHCQGNGEADVVLGVLQGWVFDENEVNPHSLYIGRGSWQLRDQHTLKTLGGLNRGFNTEKKKTIIRENVLKLAHQS